MKVAGRRRSSHPQSLQQAKATAEALPMAEHRTLDGQSHDVAPDALAPVLVEFFAPDDTPTFVVPCRIAVAPLRPMV